MSPIKIIQNSSFIKIFDGMYLNVISRSTATRRINELGDEMEQTVKKMLDNAQYVCTTADIWSAKKRIFLE